MKKLLTLCVTGLLVLSVAGCENETPDKLLGHTLYNPSDSNAASAKLAKTSVGIIQSMSSSSQGEPTSASSVFSMASALYDYNDDYISGPDSNGFYTFDMSYINDVKEAGGMESLAMRWLDSDKDPITGNSSDTFENYNEAIAESSNTAKYFNIKASLDSSSELLEDFGKISFNYTYTFDTAGDLDFVDGGTLDGEMTGKTASGIDFEATLTDLEFDSEVGINGGQLEIESHINNITYTTEITYNNDGTAEGTITSSQGYSAEIYVNTETGEGYYEDNDGKHEFS
ncbi:MAG: hypothetical protein ACQEQC_05580 [Elusimicrobiota bacterium]